MSRGRVISCAVGLMVLSAVITGIARGQSLSPEFADDLLLSRKPIYEEGLRSNLETVILPRLSETEKARLAAIELEFPMRVADAEPVAFATDGRRIVMSVSSIRFLGEISIAVAWLQLNGYTLESLTNYALMLRHGRMGAPPPAPMHALCVPSAAVNDPQVDRLAGKIFSNMLVFILLHEMGHIIYGHLEDAGDDLARERTQESDADGFALDVMARIGDSPLGIVPYFTVIAHMTRGRDDFPSDAAYHAYLESRRHPIDAERLRMVAENVREKAAAYAPTLAEGRLGFELVAIQIGFIAGTLADPASQQLMGLIGGTATEANLAPLRPGEKLGAPCDGHPPLGDGVFAGFYGGTFVGGNTSFEANAVFRQHGSHVTGAMSYGAGTVTFEGEAREQVLQGTWSLAKDQGRAVLTLDESGTLRGSSGYGEANTGGGTVALTRAAAR